MYSGKIFSTATSTAVVPCSCTGWLVLWTEKLLLRDCSSTVLMTRTQSTTTTTVVPGGIGAADREVVMCVSHLTLWLFLHSPEDEDLFSDYYHSAIFLHREGLVLRTEGLLFVCLSYSVIVPRQSWSQGPCQRRLTQLFMEGLVLWTETLLHVCLTLWLFLHCSPEDKDLFSDC